MTALHVLLVDDSAADARLLREALRECVWPMTLEWLPTAEQALARLRPASTGDSADGDVGAPGAPVAPGGACAEGPLPGIVLLDLNLPGVHGLELLGAIRSDPDLALLPVLVLSSSAARADVLAAYRAGANAYLVKPDDFQEVVTLLDTLSAHWGRAVRLPPPVSPRNCA